MNQQYSMRDKHANGNQQQQKHCINWITHLDLKASVQAIKGC